MYLKASKSVIIILMIFSSSIVFSQETINLDDAIEIALENNYSIRIVEKNNAIAENNFSYGSAGMLPVLSAGGSINKSNTNVNMAFVTGESIESSGNKSTNKSGSIDLNWTLFDGFRMFISYRKLEALKHLSDIEKQILIENTLNTVINSFYEVVRYKEELLALLENIAISNERLERIETKVEFGASLKLDALHTKVDLNRDSSNYLQTELALGNAKRNLNLILGRSPETNFDIVYNQEFRKISDQNEIKKAALGRNTSVLQALYNRQISEMEYKEIKASRYPRIDFNSSYTYSSSEADAGFFLSNESYGLNSGFTASISLFDGFRKSIQAQNARVMIDISDLQVEEIKLQIETAVITAYDNYTKRLQIYQMEVQNLKTAQQNFDRSEELYKLGQITSTELREAQLNLLSSKNSITNAYFIVKLAETELFLLSGQLLEK